MKHIGGIKRTLWILLCLLCLLSCVRTQPSSQPEETDDGWQVTRPSDAGLDVDKLNQVETEGISPTSHAISLTNAFREDTVEEHLEREKALSNAPEKEDGNFIVPKVIT